MTNLKNWILWRKKEIVFGTVVALVAIVSFGLGYLANRESNHSPIVIEKIAGT
ncbi:MAG TPA: hypothetical protein VNG29_00050 [Candidatus Paceibacterota bacterium]|nr:hypothetical protein [Candidatus Paceibacterota bacterium]